MKDEAFDLARQWRDDPALFVGDLRAATDWLLQNSTELTEADAASPGARSLPHNLVAEALSRLNPLHEALAKYAKLLKTSKLPPDLFGPLIQTLATAETASESSADAIQFAGLADISESLEKTQRWADKQVRLKGDEGNRSELLKTTIEEADDGLHVRTDENGSLKLRGSTNIPMFLAFFRNPKHRLTIDAFLDIDRTVKATNLDRHRVRLSSKLHDVLIEIVSDKDGYLMRTYREGMSTR